jgi:hypothetical protein
LLRFDEREVGAEARVHLFPRSVGLCGGLRDRIAQPAADVFEELEVQRAL